MIPPQTQKDIERNNTLVFNKINKFFIDNSWGLYSLGC